MQVARRARTLSLWLAVAFFGVSCGGSGGGGTPVDPPSPEKPSVVGRVGANVALVPEQELASAVVAVERTGGLLLKSDSATVTTLTVGQLVHLPRAGTNRVPFTGRVTSVEQASAVTTVRLRPVGVEDVFDNLSWDIDTRRAGTKIAGMIAPDGAKLGIGSMPGSKRDRARPLALTQSSGGISGSVSVSRNVIHEGKTFTLFADVELSDVSARFKGTYDKEKFLSSQGWAEISAVVRGKVTGAVGVRGEGTIPALADIISSGDVWKDLKWEGGGLFTLDGLGSADKAGRFPIGGLILVPGLGATVYRGDLPSQSLNFLAIGPSVVVWIYADASGQLTISGEVGAKVKDIDFEQGHEFRVVGTTLQSTRISSASAGAAEVYGGGSLEANQRLGMTIAADVLIAGIRPANVAAFVGADYRGTLSGSGTWRVYPIPELSGSVCASSSVWAGVELSAAFRLQATLALDESWTLFRVDGVVEGRYLTRAATWFNRDLGSSCVDSLGGAFDGRPWSPYFISFGSLGASVSTANNSIYVRTGQPRRLLESGNAGASWVARILPDGIWDLGPFVRGQTLLLEGRNDAFERIRAISRDGGRTWNTSRSRLDDREERSVICLMESSDGRVYGVLYSYQAATNSYAINRIESSADLISWRTEAADPGFRCVYGITTGALVWTGSLPADPRLSFNEASSGGGVLAARAKDGSLLLPAYSSEESYFFPTARLFRSTNNGGSWSELRDSSSAPTRRVSSPVAYGRTVVAAMSDLVTGTGSTGSVVVSQDSGATVTIRTSPGSGLRTVAVSSSGVFVAAGDQGTVVTSEDNGLSWRKRAIATTARIQAVRWGGGVFMLIDQDGSVFTSPDGRDWGRRGSISSTGYSLRDLIYHDGRWVVASAVALPGESGSSLIESRDAGTTWEYRFVSEKFMGLAVCGTTLYSSTQDGVLRARAEGASNWNEVSRSPLDARGGDFYLGIRCGNGVLIWPKQYEVNKHAVPMVFGVSTDSARTWSSRTVTGVGGEELTYTGSRWYLAGAIDSLMRGP